MANEMRRLADGKKHLMKENGITFITNQKASSTQTESIELDQKKVEKMTPVQAFFIESFNEALETKNLVLLRVGLYNRFLVDRDFLEKLMRMKC